MPKKGRTYDSVWANCKEKIAHLPSPRRRFISLQNQYSLFLSIHTCSTFYTPTKKGRKKGLTADIWTLRINFCSSRDGCVPCAKRTNCIGLNAGPLVANATVAIFVACFMQRALVWQNELPTLWEWSTQFEACERVITSLWFKIGLIKYILCKQPRTKNFTPLCERWQGRWDLQEWRTCSSMVVTERMKRAAVFYTSSNELINVPWRGCQRDAAYSSLERTTVLYKISLKEEGATLKLRHRKPSIG